MEKDDVRRGADVPSVFRISCRLRSTQGRLVVTRIQAWPC